MSVAPVFGIVPVQRRLAEQVTAGAENVPTQRTAAVRRGPWGTHSESLSV